ncbi:MAG: hypothetical protein I3270_02615 [Candidatus Moeniiplasma glomeromycotorum]|nr:hypothetical protein [Candidatus Moeniiplasma glomeromycotorum]MCE8162560.1 hypothetical protein [Candidatus Moeniiplasma glomeromycotorum]MCE8166516.1 hypothetical protein [Candidatus Moeniiplasma glomeromycotorum]MCE8166943.1 hypothetical protein [Candidatus Moeniiplasma glomeromycotorum]
MLKKVIKVFITSLVITLKPKKPQLRNQKEIPQYESNQPRITTVNTNLQIEDNENTK